MLSEIGTVIYTPIFLRMRKLKYKEEIPCFLSHLQEGMSSPYDSGARLSVTICLPVPLLCPPSTLQLCFVIGLTDFLLLCPSLQLGHILVLLLAGIPIGILLKVIFYTSWTLFGPPLDFIFIFLKLYILMKLLYFMSVSSFRVEIYREIKWSYIYYFYLKRVSWCLDHVNNLIKRNLIDLMKKRESKKEKEMKELIWVLNSGKLSQKCMHWIPILTH